MDKSFERITQFLTLERPGRYWPGFKPGAYAIYDQTSAYIINHPSFKDKNAVRQPRPEQFQGDTVIMFRGELTAIANAERNCEPAQLYATLVHELFHIHQHTCGETRFPDELKGLIYPLYAKNHEMRQVERELLLQAVSSVNLKQKRDLLKDFCAIRHERRRIAGEYVNYEEKIETVEGPAYYVEHLAMADMKNLPVSEAALQYMSGLTDNMQNIRHLRRSCYLSGMALCSLLDHFQQEWKITFFAKADTVFSLLEKALFSGQELAFSPQLGIKSGRADARGRKEREETRKIIKTVRHEREEAFEDFYGKPGYHAIIEGEMRLKRFDPVNIIAGDQKHLHTTFLQLEAGGEEIIIEKSAVAYFSSHFLHITKLHVILDEKPSADKSGVTLPGAGKLEGELVKNAGNWNVLLSD